MIPVTPRASENVRACAMAFWPVVASRTSNASCGAPGTSRAITRCALRSSSIRLVRVCSRPAVSIRTTSIARASAAFMPSKTTAEGLAPGAWRTSSAPVRAAHTASWSMAAARNVSPATTSTLRPAAPWRAASFPMVVVLPTPFTPVTSTTHGRALGVGSSTTPRIASISSWSAWRISAPPTRVRTRATSSAEVRTPTSAATSASSSSLSAPSGSVAPRRRAASSSAANRRRVARRPRRRRSTTAPCDRRRLRRGAQANRHHLRHAGLLHRDAVERIGGLHGAPVVRDQDELRAHRHVLDQLVEAPDVGLVEGSVHLIEQAERRRPDQEQRKDEGDGRERLLAPGEQAERLQLLSGRLDHDLDPGLAALLRLGLLQAGLAAREELREHLGELLVGGREGLLEAPARSPDELRDRAPEVVERALQVGALANQELVPAAQLLELGQRGRVHVAQAREANAQRLHARRTFLVPSIVGRRYLRERLRAEAVALGQLRGQVLERKTALGHGDVQAGALLARRFQPFARRPLGDVIRGRRRRGVRDRRQQALPLGAQRRGPGLGPCPRLLHGRGVP